MTRTRLYIFGILLLSAATALSACTRRDLENRSDEGYLKIDLHWNDISSPETTTYYFYRDGSEVPLIKKGDRNGYEGGIPPGSYKVVISHEGMNGATYNILGSYESDIIQANNDTRTGNDYLADVDNIFGTGCTGIVVTPGAHVQRDAYPGNYVRYVTVIVEPEGIPNISSIDIEMSGVINTIRGYDGHPDVTGTSSIKRNIPENIGEGDYTATISVFGFAGTNRVMVYITYNDGKSDVSLPIDITDQISSLPEEGGTIIIPIILLDGNEIETTLVVHPWNWGGPGNGTVE